MALPGIKKTDKKVKNSVTPDCDARNQKALPGRRKHC